MLRVSAPTNEAVSTNRILQESAPTQKATSPTVVEHVLSRLKDIGITKVFGVAGDFAFPIEDTIVGFPMDGAPLRGKRCVQRGPYLVASLM